MNKTLLEKLIFKLEIVIGIISVAFLLTTMILASFIQIPVAQVCLIILGFLIFCFGMFYDLKIEQVVGFYVCEKCGHKQVPTFKAVVWALHIGRTRYLTCEKCGEKSWQKKIIEKEKEERPEE